MPPALAWTDVVQSVALGVGLAAAVGLRVFLPMLILGGAARLGWVPLGTDFVWLASNVGLATLAIASALEVASYQVPVLDNALDAIATPTAIAAGILAIAAVTSDLPGPVRWSLAVIAGGGTAGVVQSLTTIVRLKSTGFTGGLANPLFSLVELIGAATVAVLAIAAPLLAVGLVLLLVAFFRRARGALTASRRV